jgi:hypothetical protein
MTKMINEDDMSLNTLYQHMLDSGIDRLQLLTDEDRILLHTESGTGYTISLIHERTFIRLATTLPLCRNASHEQRIAFANELNEDVFLPSFSISPRGDLRINYALPYRHGVIAGQFMSVVRRFGSMLEHVVHNKNTDGLIDFDDPNEEVTEGAELASLAMSKNSLMN